MAASDVGQRALEYSAPEGEAAGQARYERLPSPMREALLPFQREGVRFALSHGGRVLLADEMGLGKSVQALSVALCYRDEWPLLVVCPKSLCGNWLAELRRWLPLVCSAPLAPAAASAPGGEALVESGKDSLSGGCGVVVISYDLAVRRAAELRAAGFGVAIADESHALKEPESQRSKALLPLLGGVRRLVLVSGTPSPSRPAEIFTQAKLLRPGIFGRRQDFERRYAAAHQGRFGWDAKGASHVKELHAVLTHALMVRRTKAEVQSQLPPKVREVLLIDAPEAARAWARVEAERAAGPAKEHSAEMTLAYMETGRAKAAAVADHVARLLAAPGRRKLLLFGHHKAVLDLWEERLRGVCSHVRIDGEVPHEARDYRVATFQGDPAVRLAILSIRVASHGFTLTAASVVVFGELAWNASDLAQAEDRAHRISQLAERVQVFYCIARGSVDEVMWRLVEKKLQVTSSLMSG
ncbi:hypothetical protein EMIHUDRAFT_60882, partial [Emiliania huxleyi CCMP1516]|uniref:Uncharacterized protein n=2 Tax=Emiliania huxleyi TaxID=2903 RepID=A0A0D3L0B3_EMIH1